MASGGVSGKTVLGVAGALLLMFATMNLVSIITRTSRAASNSAKAAAQGVSLQKLIEARYPQYAVTGRERHVLASFDRELELTDARQPTEWRYHLRHKEKDGFRLIVSLQRPSSALDGEWANTDRVFGSPEATIAPVLMDAFVRDHPEQDCWGAIEATSTSAGIRYFEVGYRSVSGSFPEQREGVGTYTYELVEASGLCREIARSNQGSPPGLRDPSPRPATFEEMPFIDLRIDEAAASAIVGKKVHRGPPVNSGTYDFLDEQGEWVFRVTCVEKAGLQDPYDRKVSRDLAFEGLGDGAHWVDRRTSKRQGLTARKGTRWVTIESRLGGTSGNYAPVLTPEQIIRLAELGIAGL